MKALLIEYSLNTTVPWYQATVCPRSPEPFYIANFYIKWVKTTLTYIISRHDYAMSHFELSKQGNVSFILKINPAFLLSFVELKAS